MAMDQSALLELLAALKDTEVGDRIRAATEHLYQELIDAEATAVIGAGPWQRTAERTAQRDPAADVNHHRGRSGPADPQAAHRVVLPLAAGAASSGGVASHLRCNSNTGVGS